MRKTTIFRATSCSFGRAAILASGLGLLSCGKRGDPLPPLRPVPEAAQELVVRQVGDRIRLEWKAPSRNQDGTTEKLELREARVMRRVVDVDALVKEQTRPPEPVAPTEAESEESTPLVPTPVEPEAPGAPRADVSEAPEATRTGEAPAEQAAQPPPESTAAPAAPAPRPALVIPPFAGAAEVVATLESLEPGAAMRYEESIDPTWPGKRVEYAVVHVNRNKRAGPLSAIRQVDPVPAPAPPTALAAAASDGFVSLEWSPPEQPQKKDVAVGFAVFRRLEADAGYPDSPLSAETLREPFFEDRTAVFGTAACYVVTTVLEPARPEPVEAASEEAETPPREMPTVPDETPPPGVPVVPPIANPVRIESPASEEVCLTPEDVFAPAAPAGLVGVEVGEGILLTWRLVEAPDLRGYRVYRRAETSADFELLAEVETASFTDAAAAPGERYVYAVTAIDGSPAVNESPKSEAVLATRRE